MFVNLQKGEIQVCFPNSNKFKVYYVCVFLQALVDLWYVSGVVQDREKQNDLFQGRTPLALYLSRYPAEMKVGTNYVNQPLKCDTDSYVKLSVTIATCTPI